MPQQLIVNILEAMESDEVEHPPCPDHMERYPIMHIEDEIYQSFESIHILDGVVSAAQPIHPWTVSYQAKFSN